MTGPPCAWLTSSSKQGLRDVSAYRSGAWRIGPESRAAADCRASRMTKSAGRRSVDSISSIT